MMTDALKKECCCVTIFRQSEILKIKSHLVEIKSQIIQIKLLLVFPV